MNKKTVYILWLQQHGEDEEGYSIYDAEIEGIFSSVENINTYLLSCDAFPDNLLFDEKHFITSLEFRDEDDGYWWDIWFQPKTLDDF